jgi:hypothetical protein
LKQIDPALPLAGYGIAVQVRPWFQQKHYKPFGNKGASSDGVDCPNDLCQTVIRGHASRSLWNATLQSIITAVAKAQDVVGQACACCHHVWEITPHELDLSAG